MSSSKATRLVQMLGLDKMDAPKTHIHTLPAARDWCEMEERRRTLWLIFVNDRGASSTAGWPTLFNHRRVLLPTPDKLSFILNLRSKPCSPHPTRPSAWALRNHP